MTAGTMMLTQLPEQTKLRPLTRDDFADLLRWLNAPHVSKWWDGIVDEHGMLQKYEPRLHHDSPTRIYIIESDGHSVGIVQCYRHADYPEWDRAVGIANAAGIDYLVGEPSHIGKGIGTAAVRLITEVAFDAFSEVQVIVSAPQKANSASCKVLEKAGFKHVIDEKLDSDDPSDAGISSIYVLNRTVLNRTDTVEPQSNKSA